MVRKAGRPRSRSTRTTRRSGIRTGPGPKRVAGLAAICRAQASRIAGRGSGRRISGDSENVGAQARRRRQDDGGAGSGAQRQRRGSAPGRLEGAQGAGDEESVVGALGRAPQQQGGDALRQVGRPLREDPMEEMQAALGEQARSAGGGEGGDARARRECGAPRSDGDRGASAAPDDATVAQGEEQIQDRGRDLGSGQGGEVPAGPAGGRILQMEEDALRPAPGGLGMEADPDGRVRPSAAPRRREGPRPGWAPG